MPCPPKIYFDESGQTGEDLLNPEQQAFALASVMLEPNQAQELLALLPPSQASERKASRLLKSPRGRQAALRLIKHDLLSGDNCRAYLIDKLFMASTVLVDVFHYEFTRELGYDMHSDGSAAALPHLLHLTGPTIFGQNYYRELLTRFVRFMRKPTPRTIDDFYLIFDFLFVPLQITRPKSAMLWEPVHYYRYRIREDAPNYTGVGYNPVITALFAMIHTWGSRLGRRFDIVFDDNTSMDQEKILVEKMSDPNHPPISTGYGERSAELPLKVNSFTFATSDSSPEIQVADLVAGIAREALKQWMKPSAERNEMFEALTILGDKDILDGLMVPNKEAISEGAGLLLPGTNAAETMAAFLSRSNYVVPSPRS